MMKEIDIKKLSSVISLSFLVLFLIVSCDKRSSDWVEYRTDKDGYVSSYKKVNIQKDDGNYIVQVWDKYVFSDKGKEIIIQDMTKNGLSTKGYDKLSNKMFLVEIDCKKQRYKILSIKDYDANGNVLFSYYVNKRDWDHVTSDTKPDFLRKSVCN